MEELQKRSNDEIDLFELIETIWDGKWKVLLAIFISILVTVVFLLARAPQPFLAKTILTPINSVEAGYYRQSNALGFFSVTPSILQSLYMENLYNRTLFVTAIKQYELLKKGDYLSDADYNEAVERLASTIVIRPPINVDGKDKGERRGFWTLEFEYNDEKKWKSVLSFVQNQATELTRIELQKRFLISLSIAKQKQEFELEDLNVKIANALVDYDKKTAHHLSFLREQAAIARKLDVASNTIETQMFNSQTSVVTNVKSDTPFYLRGYTAIEKEIELIESREDKEAFIDSLFGLEQKKRALQQDQTLERAKGIFEHTPIETNDKFSAMSLKIETTDFKYKSKPVLMLSLAAILGSMIGIIYVLIASSVRNRKNRIEAVGDL